MIVSFSWIHCEKLGQLNKILILSINNSCNGTLTALTLTDSMDQLCQHKFETSNAFYAANDSSRSMKLQDTGYHFEHSSSSLLTV